MFCSQDGIQTHKKDLFSFASNLLGIAFNQFCYLTMSFYIFSNILSISLINHRIISISPLGAFNSIAFCRRFNQMVFNSNIFFITFNLVVRTGFEPVIKVELLVPCEGFRSECFHRTSEVFHLTTIPYFLNYATVSTNSTT